MISTKFLVSTAAAAAVIGAAGFAFAQSTPGGTTESPTATPPLQSQGVTPVTPGNPGTMPAQQAPTQAAPAADSAAPASPSGTMGNTGSSGTMGSTGTSDTAGTTGSSGVITERPAQADRN